MYRGNRYKETRFGQEKKPNVPLRIIISVAVAVIISFGLIIIGARLGEMVLTEETTGREEITTASPSPKFEFKDVPKKLASDSKSVALLGETKPDLAVLNVSDSKGKLNCITSINSLLYGDAVSSELRPIEALLHEAKTWADGVSLRFTPFVTEDSREYGDLCSAMVIGALAGYSNVDEIAITLDGVTPDLAARLRESAQGKARVGGVITLEMLLRESLVKEYYNALDFLVIDLTPLDIKAAGAQGGDVTTDTAEETESETESASSGYPPFGSVESVVNSYGLMLVKYSVRLCITCENEQDLSDFTALYGAFEFCGYEIFSKK